MIIPVILCGGAGVRLWPLSRESTPKQFLPLVGGRSTFAMTLERVADPGIFARPLIVANAEHRYLVSEALRAAEIGGEILLEPARRDSAAAIASAAALVAGRDADALLLVLAADHVIHDVAGFRSSVRIAEAAAREGHIVTFGIRPSVAATGYGYIRPGAALPGQPRVAVVDAFAEKPDAATAERYVAEGYLWNSGNFMMPAALAMAELGRHAQAIAAAVEAAVAEIASAPGFLRLPAERYKAAPAMSFDYAVMERTERAAVIAADFDWRDLGSWESLSEIAGRDGAGNSMIGDVVARETSGSYIHAAKGVVALLGVDDLIVASSGDAVLVAARDRMDSVKELVAEIGRTRPDTVDADRRGVSPWGFFEVIGNGGAGYQVKRIVVEPGARLSLQRHLHRAEHWVVVAGIADVTIGTETRRLLENQSAFIGLHEVHRLANPGEEPLVVIEVQYGDYLGEDDIERLADDYDRRVDGTSQV